MAGEYQYIHFATHGQFSPDNPLQSALLLSPDARSNGMLNGWISLYSMRLDHPSCHPERLWKPV
jgi:CHAT domain-containing protein